MKSLKHMIRKIESQMLFQWDKVVAGSIVQIAIDRYGL